MTVKVNIRKLDTFLYKTSKHHLNREVTERIIQTFNAWPNRRVNDKGRPSKKEKTREYANQIPKYQHTAERRKPKSKANEK